MTKIITALDVNNYVDLHWMLSQLDPSLTRVKIGKELFTAIGPKAITLAHSSGFDVFLDLKFHDIPTTVEKAVRVAAHIHGVWMVNVHACGRTPMLRAAMEGASGTNTLVTAVTELTSVEDRYEVPRMALESYMADVDGVVCSAGDIPTIRKYLVLEDNAAKPFITVCPGIRMPDDPRNDQASPITPNVAINMFHADHIVIGRPITCHNDPAAKLKEITESIK